MNSYQIDMSAQQLMARARKITGIEIIDTPIEEPLERLLEALNHEAELSESGVHGMKKRIERLLCNRLRMERDYLLHPEIDDQELGAILQILGLGRTGSTKLHKMLAASGDFKYTQFWQVHSPGLITGNRDEDPALRLKEADEYTQWFANQSPETVTTHQLSTYETEEDLLLYEHCLFAPYTNVFVHIPSYLAWYAQQSQVDQIAYVKRVLKYLQWQFYDGDSRPWILKDPHLTGWESILLEEFPGIRFVTTHRDPQPVVISGSSLLSYYAKAYSDADRTKEVAPFMMDERTLVIYDQMKFRDSHPEIPFLDTKFSEVTKQGMKVVEDVYNYLDMPLSDQARENMTQWERENYLHKQGVHKYVYDKDALAPEKVKKVYGPYIERFGEFF